MTVSFDPSTNGHQCNQMQADKKKTNAVDDDCIRDESLYEIDNNLNRNRDDTFFVCVYEN